MDHDEKVSNVLWKIYKEVGPEVWAPMACRYSCANVLLAFALLIGGHVTSLAGQTSAPSCDGSTIEDFDPSMAKGARAFLSALNAAIQAHKEQQVASMAAYPLRIYQNDRKKTIHNAREFVAEYSQLITPHIKQAVASQSAACLFANYQGVMIGRGEIWFQEQRHNSFKIVTINVGPEKAK